MSRRDRSVLAVRIAVVWMIKHTEAVLWASDVLRKAIAVALEGSFSIEVFVTKEPDDTAGDSMVMPNINDVSVKAIAHNKQQEAVGRKSDNGGLAPFVKHLRKAIFDRSLPHPFYAVLGLRSEIMGRRA